ncbi:hypothetical protein FB565_006174 [Actinoplanes lutulentus]|uniref:hypothetical protein n=1 Tax=Actinoplanes lutulentus TaxID=1287878 RepID=UPI000DB931EE|nr:hypothetical protein [Actinoplanes lutulentus]MBB2946406.1 hypothetical protein [Actinoplanes lutulentus]
MTRSDLTRVVPDVLADDILETEAVTGRHATGFVLRLWDAFGSPYEDLPCRIGARLSGMISVRTDAARTATSNSLPRASSHR